MSLCTRRDFVRTCTAAGIAGSLTLAGQAAAEELSVAHVPIRAITRGPKFHWFGYYDKFQFDPSGRYVLSNEVDFEHRSPDAGDVIGIGMVDTHNDDRWIELGTSSAWGWQQGCMLQWVPGSDREVIWNDREGDRFVARIVDVQSGARRTLPMPVYTLSPDGSFALCVDFARIQNMRPGYGYAGIEDPRRDVRAPADGGIWRMDLKTGDTQLLFSHADAAAIPFHGGDISQKWHYFNHLLINPAGTRFIVLHRWRDARRGDPDFNVNSGFVTRMFTIGVDGKDPYILDPSGFTSHFIWRDPEHVCAWTRPLGRKDGFYLFTDGSSECEIVGDGVMKVNGHNTYLAEPYHEWILNDTYPQGRDRQQIVYLYHVPTGKRVELGRFPSPAPYQGEWRCDTHPRSSRDGRTVAIDSPHGGNGRQLYLLDISSVITPTG